MLTSKYIIFDCAGGFYEYNARDAFDAIDKYILTDCNDFHVTIDMWNKIKNSCEEIEERIKLVNELCEHKQDNIEKVIGNYTYLYGDEISPLEKEVLHF